jgi:hypothetical protein|nr:MAG TPA: tail assembly chaperone protein [Caudoviricetes sp.]
MKNLNSFLHPERKPNAVVRLHGFSEPFELKVLSHEDDRTVNEKYQNRSAKDRLDAYVAYALVNPDLRDAGLLDELQKRDGRPYTDPLDVLHALFTSAEVNTLFNEYSKLSDLTSEFAQKVEEAKN